MRLRSAGAVDDAQEMVLGDAQRGQRGPEFERAHRAQAFGRPPLWIIGAALAERGRHADNAVAGVSRGRHQPRGQERLVVGMGPDAQHRAELRGVGDA
jgi:hypothetical protein